jgi:hypothetical protein
MWQRNLTPATSSVGISQLAQDGTLCCFQEILYTISSSFPSHRLHRRITCGFVDSIDNTVQHTTAIRLLFRTVSSWQPAAIRTPLPPATETAGKLSLMSERGNLLSLSSFLQVSKDVIACLLSSSLAWLFSSSLHQGRPCGRTNTNYLQIGVS